MMRQERQKDAGVSLIELVVAMMLTALLGVLLSTMFIQILRTTTDSQNSRTASGTAYNAMDEISRVVRQGTQVPTSLTASEGAVLGDVNSLCAGATGSTPTCLIIDAFADSAVAPAQARIAPVRVVMSVKSNGYLVEKRYSPTLTNGYYSFTSGGVPTSTRTVAGPLDVSGTGSAALFVYRDSDGNIIVPGPSGLTAVQASTVASVAVNVTVANSNARGSDAVQLSNQITMPNVAIANGGN